MKLKSTRWIALALTIALSSDAAGGAAEWRTFSSSAGGFSVSLPGRPDENSESYDTKDGKVVWRRVAGYEGTTA